MWPFSEMSLPVASLISTIANWTLLGSLVVGVLSTFVIVKTSDVKEEHWDADRRQSNIRIAELNSGTAKLVADNLALQTAMLPRHVGLIGFDGPPKALEWFAGLEAFAGTQVLVQVVHDDEAGSLANEIMLVLAGRGWKPQGINDGVSNISRESIRDGVTILYPTGKPWTAVEPNQPWMAWSKAADALANALTRAGLGMGNFPVSVGGFTNDEANKQFRMIPYFDPPLSGVYLQVGSRPIEATIQWIKQGRPDGLGNRAGAVVPTEPHN